jgi:hypothetical protein
MVAQSMNAFLQRLASFPIPVEDIAKEFAYVTFVIVVALYVLADYSPWWFYLPFALWVFSRWLWWKLDQFPRG